MDNQHAETCASCGATLSTTIPARMEEAPGNEHLKRVVEVAIAGGHSVGVEAERRNFASAQVLGRVAAEHGAAAFVVQPCPCGCYGSAYDPCFCEAEEIAAYQATEAYQNAVRADMFIVAVAPSRKQMEAFLAGRRGEATEAVLARIRAAPEEVGDEDEWARRLLATVADRLRLDIEELAQVRAVARTIARLSGTPYIRAEHAAEAIQYRPRR